MWLFSAVAICLALVLGQMLLPMPPIGATPRYAYTKIADTVGDLQEIANAGINNSGTVVFLALFDAGGRAIISGDEQRLLIVADTRTGAFEDLVESASVNDRGIVAFASRGTGAAVWKWDAGRLRLLADSTTGPYRSFGGMSISATSDVAFWSQLADGSDGIFVSVNDTRVVRIAGGKDGMRGLDTSPAIGNSGVVAFVGQIPATGINAVLLADQKALRTLTDASGRFAVFDGGVTVNARAANSRCRRGEERRGSDKGSSVNPRVDRVNAGYPPTGNKYLQSA
jgi:hypothetical protein